MLTTRAVSSVPRINTTISTPSTTNDDDVNPFDSPRTYSSDNSTISLPSQLQRVLLPAKSSQRYMAQSQHRNDSIPDREGEILGAEQEPETAYDEKIWTHKRQQTSTDRISRHTHDPEKAYPSPRTSQPQLSIRRSSDSINDVSSQQAQKALRVLIHLSGPCVFLSFLTLLWAILSVLVTLIYQPLRLCTPRLPIRQQISHFLAPTLNLHLRCIHVPVFPRPTDDREVYSASWLLIVHMIAPAVSLGTMVAAWVVAVYWGLASIVGDPTGVDKKDDGVEAVLGLARFWQSLLMKGVMVET